MSRLQLSINVSDVDEAVAFYTKLLGVEPVKHHESYANFVSVEPSFKLILIEGEGEAGTINHLGIEYPNGDAVADKTRQIADTGLEVLVEDEHTCCYATQQKAWARDPAGLMWEVYTVVEDTTHFGANSHAGSVAAEGATHTALDTVDADDVAAALATETAIVIDAQGVGGFERAHIEGAVDFSYYNIEDQAAAIVPSKDHPIIVYCTDVKCIGSEVMGAVLVEAGYSDVRRYPGGVADWKASGRPVVEGAPAKG